MKYAFLKRDKDKVFLEYEKMEIFIPKTYFDLNIANLYADNLKVLGIFNFTVTNKNRKEKYRLNFPSVMTIGFSDSYETKELDSNGEEEKVVVFVLHKGDLFMMSEYLIIDAGNVTNFVNLFHSGKLPVSEYEEIYHQYMQVQKDNSIDLKVDSSTIEGIVSELVRWKKDKTYPFRIALNNGAKKDDFQIMQLKLIPELSSTFSGIAFENINRAVVSGVNKKRYKKENNITSMERTIKY